MNDASKVWRESESEPQITAGPMDRITPDDLYDYLDRHGMLSLVDRYFRAKRRVNKFKKLLEVDDAVVRVLSLRQAYQRDKKLVLSCQVVLRGRLRAAGFVGMESLPILLDALFHRGSEGEKDA